MDIKELLGTEDEEEQVKKVQALMDTATRPPIDVLIRYDQNADQISLSFMGGNVPFEVIYRALDLARQALHKSEIEAAVQQKDAAEQDEEEVEE